MKGLTLIFLLTFNFVFCQNSGINRIPSAEITRYVQKVKQAYHLPGIVVAITDADGINYIEEFGSVEKEERFLIGSCSKSFTALLILKLQERGLLNIDDPVTRHLNWFEYSNINYRLLGYIIEDKTNKSFGEVLKSEITKPLQMDNTSGFATNDIVQGYQYFLFYSILPKKMNYHQDNIPEAYISSTALDMSKYLRALMNSYKGQENAIIDTKITNKLFEPNYQNNSNYGLGWEASNYEGHKIIHHDGAVQSFQSYMLIVPELNKSIVILTNTYGADVSEIGLGIVNIILGKKPVEKSKTRFYLIRSVPFLVLVLLLVLILVLRKWMRLQKPISYNHKILPNILLQFGLALSPFWIIFFPYQFGASLETIIDFDPGSGYSLICLTVFTIITSLGMYFNSAKKTLPHNTTLFTGHQKYQS